MTEEEAKKIAANKRGFRDYKDFYWLTYDYQAREDARKEVEQLMKASSSK